MRRWSIIFGIGLALIIAGCRSQPTPTPTLPPTAAPNIVTLPPNPTVPPTWTPVPVSPSPTKTLTPDVTAIVETATPPPTHTPYPGCLEWQTALATGQVANEEEFAAGETVVIRWPVMPGAEGYRFTVNDPQGRLIHEALIPQPAPEAEDVAYAIDPAFIPGSGYGYGWQASPYVGREFICYPVSGEFHYIVETAP